MLLNLPKKILFSWKVGVLFGLKLGITNLGLKMIEIGPHLLLQSTDIMWTILFAYLMIGERLSFVEGIACFGTSIGSILIAFRANERFNNLPGVLVNLTSPILLGLVVIELKRSSKLALEQSSRVFKMTILEFTAFKLFFSSLSVVPFLLLLEFASIRSNNLTWSGEPLLNIEFLETKQSLLLFCVGGGIITLFFQLNFTWLVTLTSAVTVGITTGAKILPQFIGSLVFTQTLDLNPFHLIGSLCIFLSSCLWLNVKYSKDKKNLEYIPISEEESEMLN